MFGLPIGITLAIVVDMGVVGMWIGLAIAGSIQSISYSIVLLCLNWPKEAMLAMKRGQGTITKWKKNDSNNSGVELKEYSPLEDDNIGDHGNDNHAGNNNTVELNEYSPLDDDNIGDHGNDNHGNNNDIGSGIGREEETDEEDLITATDNTDDVTSSADNNPLINSNTDDVILSFKDRIKGRVKIILCHCVLVIIAIICLIVSGILSIIHPPDNIINGNYSDCTDNITLEY